MKYTGHINQRAAGERSDMDILEDDLRCVAFLFGRQNLPNNQWEKVPLGTGFFVLYPDETSPNIEYSYLVTARHVIEDFNDDDTIFVRVSSPKGGVWDRATKAGDWKVHETADVAIIPFSPPMTSGINHIPLWSFVDDDYRYRGQPLTQEDVEAGSNIEVRLGHDLYFLGLFSEHIGDEQILPIARFGNISRMPKEPITLERNNGTSSFKTAAYLAECLSWGGISGSPTFWVHPTMLSVNTDSTHKIGVLTNVNVVGFLGLVSGHYDIFKKAKTTGDILETIETALNSGIAIITPANLVRQLLERPDVMERRKQLSKESLNNKRKPTLDSAQRDQVTQEDMPVFTKADFESALRKASRPNPEPPQPDEGKNETSE